ncbi:MAG: energy-converting hydrogenase B subunit J [Methanobrevibacter sp.]|nr:energy-converting hydrogenase B subunit J [Candidatus Methanoflexus mossambicus]
MINLGPIIFGFLIGFIVGLAMKKNPKSEINLTSSSFIVIFLVILLSAWQLGAFPYYTDIPIATGFLSGFIGILIGKIAISLKSGDK